MKTLYVIEARNPDGSLSFAEPQPPFGPMDADTMAKLVWRHNPDAVLTGDSVPLWPSLVDPRWRARIKTW